ncbi:hypothetical protein MTR67_019368 [Solanum verrucosum]|uniref:Uncharacterized protein n=1 Tax=Solanum verrucosum TaxID=315347 RepID=A0AAF0QPF6_SOLVR|nr:hypothetical protein MTR67_019368 [Solanum verrucosum]
MSRIELAQEVKYLQLDVKTYMF